MITKTGYQFGFVDNQRQYKIVQSDNDLHPGAATKDPYAIASGMVAELSFDDTELMSVDQLETVWLIGYGIAKHIEIRQKGHRGRTGLPFYHLAESLLLRNNCSKLGRFVIGGIGFGIIELIYELPHVDDSQNWSYRPVRAWLIGSEGTILRERKVR